uniref:Uncharacterized protein n=1 Tax=Anguilla anguilla TaxID=7936 RepID=A0A0E9TUY5_ANGAN
MSECESCVCDVCASVCE